MTAGEEYKIPVADRLKRLPPYLFGKLNSLRDQKRRAGIDIIDLGMGNPSDPPPEAVTEKLREAVLDARNNRYSVSIGVYNLRRELARLYAAHWGVQLDPGTEVVATIGSKEGFSHLCLALLGPGDTALVPSPAFPIHMYAVILAGANVINVRLAPGPELIKSFVDVTNHLQPKPKVVIVNFPHNPTTMTTDIEFYRELVKFAKKYEVMVISDLAYGLTTFDGYKAPSFLEVPGAKDVGVEFTTMSKPFNMAGWRIGFCAGNADICKALAKIKGYYDYGIFQAAQIAAIVGMRNYAETAPKQALIYQHRRDVLCDGLNRIGWDVEKPKASMFVWAKMPDVFQAMGSMDYAMWLMENAEVSVSPGRGFGDYGEGYLRMALVENEQRLKQAIRQIDRATKKYIAGMQIPDAPPRQAVTS
jgi:alanine-synthesizing transaminase